MASAKGPLDTLTLGFRNVFIVLAISLGFIYFTGRPCATRLERWYLKSSSTINLILPNPSDLNPTDPVSKTNSGDKAGSGKDLGKDLENTEEKQLSLETPRRQRNISRELWLNEFTPGIPEHLQVLLQDILLRDFERTDAEKPTRCGYGYFRLKGMDTCHEWLGCDETEKLIPGEVYGKGVGKIIYASKWRNHDIALVVLRQDRYQLQKYIDRVETGVKNMLKAQSSPYVTQVVGYCNRGNNTSMVMEGCTYGTFRQFHEPRTFKKLSIIEKFKFAIQIVAEYDYLHRGFGLPRVHCDVHKIQQAFRQWVVSDDRRVFLNDLDELPVVDKENDVMAICEHEPNGIMKQPEFLAPEIRYTEEEYLKRAHQKPVDEASDIWKIPDLTANVLVIQLQSGGRQYKALAKQDFAYYLKSQLKAIHDRCKSLNPASRPTAREILVEYLEIYQKLLETD